MGGDRSEMQRGRNKTAERQKDRGQPGYRVKNIKKAGKEGEREGEGKGIRKERRREKRREGEGRQKERPELGDMRDA